MKQFSVNLEWIYPGPIDGHDYNDLIRALNKAKNSNNSIVVHVLTKKGKGYSFAENDSQGKWHGVSPFRVETGEPIKQIKENYKTWSEIVASQVYKAMAFDQNIVAITPAMISGSKMENIFRDFPYRSFDVGIAETTCDHICMWIKCCREKTIYFDVFFIFTTCI